MHLSLKFLTHTHTHTQNQDVLVEQRLKKMNTKEFRPLYLDFQFVMTLNTDREHTFKSQVFTPYLNFKSIVTIAVQPRKADSGSLGTLLWPRSQGEDEALDLRRP